MPLFLANRNGHRNIVEFLLQMNNIDVSVQNKVHTSYIALSTIFFKEGGILFQELLNQNPALLDTMLKKDAVDANRKNKVFCNVIARSLIV